MRIILAAAILFTPASLWAGEKTVPRYVEFRDGSILRLNVIDEDWPITIIRENGAVKHGKVKLSAIDSFTLTAEKGFTDKLEMLSNVRKLGSEDFWDREKAMAKLLKSERNIRADLETCLRFITDLETEVRIKRIQANFPKPAADEPPLPTHFDLFYYKEICWGHLGDEGIPILNQGKKLRLTRADVKRMSVEVPAQLAGLTRTRGVAVGVRRLAIADFPAGCVEEGFERAPDGRPLVAGENVQKLFVPRGFVLSTSVANSFVSINSFTVSGKSRGFSVANHQPLWEGEITIRFVLPGREDVPAGVTHFGCYLAAVVPKGTALVAEDIHGRELGRVETQNNGHDFVGIQSPVPMHKIRIVPDTKLDRDYTLDDFIFTPPQPVQSGNPKKYTAYLDMGRAHLRDVVFARDQLHILGMPGRLPDLLAPRTEVWRINAPDELQGKATAAQTRVDGLIRQLASDVVEKQNLANDALAEIGPAAIAPLQKAIKSAKLPAAVNKRYEDLIERIESNLYLVELRDGSVLTGYAKEGKNRPEFPRSPDLFLKPEQIAGLWRKHSPRFSATAKHKVPIFWNAKNKEWQHAQSVRFLNMSVEVKIGDKVTTLPYGDGELSAWSAAARDRLPSGTWLIHTKAGDELVLDSQTPITGKWSEELVASWQGKELRLAGSEIRAVSRVGEDDVRPAPKTP